MKDKALVNRLGNFVTAHPWWTLILTLVVVSVLSLGARDLGFKNDYRIYFSKENPQLQAFEAIQDTYSKSDNVMFVFETEEDDVFNAFTLQAIHQLTEELWQLPYSSRVDSITNFQHTVAVGDDLTVADLVTDPFSLTEKDLENIKQVALNEPLLVHRLISSTGHVTGVNVIVQLPGKNAREATYVAAEARKMAAEIEAQYPGIKLHLTGMVMMNNAFSESSENDLKTLVPLMYGIVILALLLSLRSLSATFSVIFLIVLSISSALGITGWLGWYLTPTSAIAPTIILTMAVADCVHVLVTMLHNMRIGHDKKQAIRNPAGDENISVSY